MRDERGVERHHHEVEHGAGPGEQRHAADQHGKERDARELPASRIHALAPNRPCGRNSTTRKMAKMPIWPSDSPRQRPPSDSATPTSKPPASAPAKLPMPPSTTMVKATSTKPPPTCGLT